MYLTLVVVWRIEPVNAVIIACFLGFFPKGPLCVILFSMVITTEGIVREYHKVDPTTRMLICELWNNAIYISF